MSDPIPAHPILKAVTRILADHFLELGGSTEAARRDAAEAVAACDPRTPHDHLLVGRLLSLSLAVISATARAIKPGLPARQQLQFLAKASTLSRSAQQAEAALARSRRTQPPVTSTAPAAIPVPAEPPPHAEPPPRATPALPRGVDHPADDALQILINQVMAEDQAMRPSTVSASPRPGAQDKATPHRANAAQHRPAMPPSANARPASFRDALLQSSALPMPSRR